MMTLLNNAIEENQLEQRGIMTGRKKSNNPKRGTLEKHELISLAKALRHLRRHHCRRHHSLANTANWETSL